MIPRIRSNPSSTNTKSARTEEREDDDDDVSMRRRTSAAVEDDETLLSLVDAIVVEDWDRCDEILDLDTTSAEQWTKVPCFVDCRGASTVLPIHVASSTFVPLPIFSRILEAHREGAKEKESGFGRLPLHLACRSDSSFDVVWSLVKTYPDATRIPDNMGRLPLSYAIRFGASEDIVSFLLSINPLAAQHYDRAGWLPLHLALQNASSPEIVKMLIDAYPAATSKTTATGMSSMSIMHMSRKHGSIERSLILDLLGKHTVYDRNEFLTDRKSELEDPPIPPSAPSTPKTSNYNLKRCLDVADKAQSVPHLHSGQQHLSPTCVSMLNEDMARMTLFAGGSPMVSPPSSPPTSPRGIGSTSLSSMKRSPHLKRATSRRIPLIPRLALRRPARQSVLVESTSSPQLQLNRTSGHSTMAGDITTTNWDADSHEIH